MAIGKGWWLRGRRLANWAWRSWPVIVPIALICLWALLAYRLFPNQQTFLTRWASALLQVFGGAIILVSINSNFGLLRAQSLWDVLVRYVCDIPWNARSVSVNITGSQTTSAFGQVAFAHTVHAVTLEEKLAKLEADFKHAKEEAGQRFADVMAKIDAVNARLASALVDRDQRHTSLEKRLDEIGVGGFKGQLFGALLACSGAVLSALV